MQRSGPNVILPVIASMPKTIFTYGLLLLASSCFDRAHCERDSQCEESEICYFDGYCLPRDVAKRAGGPVGTECSGDDSACVSPGYCMSGFCTGEPVVDTTPPVFAGLVEAIPDGEGALLVYWDSPQDEQTFTSAIEVLVYRARGEEPMNFVVPFGTVKGSRFFREDGLTVGDTFRYAARARDEAGNMDNNEVEVSAIVEPAVTVSPGVSFDDEIMPIFTDRCVICHGGAGGLNLDSFENVLIGGFHGTPVVSCQPDASILVEKIGADPSFGERMPRTGPPFLTMLQVATITQWVADGAEAQYDETTCPYARTSP